MESNQVQSNVMYCIVMYSYVLSHHVMFCNVCVFTCMHLPIYINIYYIYMCVYIVFSIYIYIQTFMYIYLYINIYMDLWYSHINLLRRLSGRSSRLRSHADAANSAAEAHWESEHGRFGQGWDGWGGVWTSFEVKKKTYVRHGNHSWK